MAHGNKSSKVEVHRLVNICAMFIEVFFWFCFYCFTIYLFATRVVFVAIDFAGLIDLFDCLVKWLGVKLFELLSVEYLNNGRHF